ncbi:peroxiredoxin [Candidatus Eisenbacteria bacterium]|uniref:Peroxiredoxin n=1 Tax=Eiseniibacteriota bacterium TaxID=2212470 RepID=A0ABV6YP90_UNCEI
MADAIKVGAKAPDFTLKDHNGNDVTLSQLKGKKVVLGFHPLAWTGVCAEQMKNLEKYYDRMAELNAVALGMSIDTSFSKHAWAKSLGIEKTPLLADFWPHGGVIQSYGVFNDEVGASKRTVFIVDEEGTVIWHKIYPVKEVPDMEEIIKALE